MRKFPLLIVSFLAIAVASSASGTTQDSVVGAGVYLGDKPVTINASSGSAGENATGQVTYVDNPGDPVETFAVVCLHVAGNVGWVLADTRSSPNFEPDYMWWIIEDNGATGDRITERLVPTADCANPPDPTSDGHSFFALDAGDLVVLDDAEVNPPGVPTRAQCQNGGYASFGFKNQGQCIAFANRPDH